MSNQSELSGTEPAIPEYTMSAEDESAEPGHDELRSINEALLLELESYRAREKSMEKYIAKMEEQIAKLHSFAALTVCVGCKSVRDESNTWFETELFLSRHTGVVTRSICPSCNSLIDSGSYR